MILPLAEDTVYRGRLEKARRRSVSSGRQYTADPLGYAKSVLGVTWWAKQQEIALSVRDNPRTLVKAAFGVGKTHVSGGLVNWFFDTFPGSVIPTLAPTGHQVKDLLWKEIRVQRRTPPPCDVLQLRDPNNPDHYAVGFSPKKDVASDELGAQAAQGFHAEHLLFVMDEAAGVREEIWQAVEGVAVGGHNRVLAIGNPLVASGPFFEAARSGRWNVVTVSALEHPNIIAGLAGKPEPYPGAVSLAWLLDRLEDPYWVEVSDPSAVNAFEFPPGSGNWYSPLPIGEAKILGLFPSMATTTVWSMTQLELARQRNLSWADEDPLEFGLDVARFGDDMTVLHCRRGPCSLAHRGWKHQDNMSIAGLVKNMVLDIWDHYDKPRVIIRVDTSGGHGTGPADALRETLVGLEIIRIVDVSASEAADEPEKYINRRSELWFAAAERGRQGNLDLSRLDRRVADVLIAQLTAPKFKYDSQGRRVVEGKDETKRRIRRSPDDADAFNLAYAGIGRQTAAIPAAGQRSQWKQKEDKMPQSWGEEGGRWRRSP